MSFSSFTILASLSIFLLPNVYAFTCKMHGRTVECSSFSKPFCCDNYCCDLMEYSKSHSGPPTGMIVAFVVISVIFIVIGCCCRRYTAIRNSGERALYGAETDPITAVPNARYPHQVQPPPVTNPYSPSQPSPYQPPQPVPYPPQQPLPYDPPPSYDLLPSYPTGQPLYPTGHPPYPARHPPYPVEHPPYPVEHPPYPVEHPPYPVGHPPYPVGHPPYPAGQQYRSIERKF